MHGRDDACEQSHGPWRVPACIAAAQVRKLPRSYVRLGPNLFPVLSLSSFAIHFERVHQHCLHPQLHFSSYTVILASLITALPVHLHLHLHTLPFHTACTLQHAFGCLLEASGRNSIILHTHHGSH